jgi:hypothetical protein
MESELEQSKKWVIRLTLSEEDYNRLLLSSMKNLEFNVNVGEIIDYNEFSHLCTFDITFRNVHVRQKNQLFAMFFIKTFSVN